MKIFVTTDTHFGHAKLATEFKSRPSDFETRIVSAWREEVAPEDIIIHLGDFVVGNTKHFYDAISQLPGRKILVLGNHDARAPHWYMTKGFDFCCSDFSWTMFGCRILFSHEPTLTGAFDVNIHGHLHTPGRHEECSRDARHFLLSLEECGYRPQLLESIIKRWQRVSNG